MSITWQKRISHIDRPVKRRQLAGLGVGGGMKKDLVRRQRGLPSRNVPSEIALNELRVDVAVRLGQMTDDQAKDLRRHLFQELLRDRLNERRRRMKAQHQRPRLRRDSTNIFLWQRRRDWLAQWGQPQSHIE